MYSFRNDYADGAHPVILESLIASNLEQTPGYTEDIHCINARKAICNSIIASDAYNVLDDSYKANNAIQVEFVHGGTMANLLAIGASLRPHECVIAAPDGHINVHETGAIEANGHKVLTTADTDGLLSVENIDQVLRMHLYGTNFHMVKPRMLYVSLATEMGLVFNRTHLIALYNYAHEHDLRIYVDGARLAVALCTPKCDITLADLARYTDVFSIGGTKNGALFGEALVITNPEIMQDFRYIMKQKGAVMAKGRTLGVQYETFFTVCGTNAGVKEALPNECLYFALGRHSLAMARKLKEVLACSTYNSFAYNSPTNQQFLLLDNTSAQFFINTFDADVISYPDEMNTIVRMTTRWSTTYKHINFVQEQLAKHPRK